MRFDATELDGAWLIGLEPGRSSRTFRAHLPHARIRCTWPRNHLRAAQHIVFDGARDYHFQCEPAAELKIVSCVRGVIFDVIVDLRRRAPTYRRWQGFELSAENRRRLYIPAGYAHGFQTLSDDTEVEYLISEFNAPQCASGVRYNDPAFAISWPLPVTSISNRDQSS